MYYFFHLVDTPSGISAERNFSKAYETDGRIDFLAIIFSDALWNGAATAVAL